eukprot:TRINITY_DN2446_c1_g1_i2.p1 TRINITY_DN2446_c1_g1~~TRINITY_DN2446_c1_g1_i2.p1  ORF type:complete len:834 (+),score=168.99 TRINITY_DN2446_c1_g1_i2:47-2548(+)
MSDTSSDLSVSVSSSSSWTDGSTESSKERRAIQKKIKKKIKSATMKALRDVERQVQLIADAGAFYKVSALSPSVSSDSSIASTESATERHCVRKERRKRIQQNVRAARAEIHNNTEHLTSADLSKQIQRQNQELVAQAQEFINAELSKYPSIPTEDTSQYARVDAKETFMIYPVLIAGDLASVKEAIPSVMLPNDVIDESCATPLSFAVQAIVLANDNGWSIDPFICVVEYLLSAGGDARFVNRRTKYSLIDVIAGDAKIMLNERIRDKVFYLFTILIEAGADANRVNPVLNHSIMWWSFAHGVFLIDFSDLLISLGHTVTGDNEDMTIMQLLCSMASYTINSLDGLSEKKLLYIVDSWARSNPLLLQHRDKMYNTFFHYAATFGMPISLLSLLLRKGCDPNAVTLTGATPYKATVLTIAAEPPDSRRLDRLYRCAAFLHPYVCPDLPDSMIPKSVLTKIAWVEIGAGSSCSVYKARYSAIREDVAVKELLQSKEKDTKEAIYQRAKLRQEIAELHSCRCTFVLTAFGYMSDEETGSLCLVTELCTGSLRKMLQREGPSPLLRSLDFVSQAGRALLYLHVNKKCHCDVAARSVLLAPDGCLKLGNFSHACRAKDLCSTVAVAWASPELLGTLSHRRLANTANDVWAFGVLMWEIWSGGKEPFGELGHNMEGVKDHVLDGGRLAKPDACPEEVWQGLVLPCFEAEESRPSMSELLEKVGKFEEQHKERVLTSAADDPSLPTKDRLERALLRESLSDAYPDYGKVYGSIGSGDDYYGNVYGDVVAKELDEYYGCEYGGGGGVGDNTALERDMPVYEVYGTCDEEPFYLYAPPEWG